jgi:hypothetical protein
VAPRASLLVIASVVIAGCIGHSSNRSAPADGAVRYSQEVTLLALTGVRRTIRLEAWGSAAEAMAARVMGRAGGREGQLYQAGRFRYEPPPAAYFRIDRDEPQAPIGSRSRPHFELDSLVADPELMVLLTAAQPETVDAVRRIHVEEGWRLLQRLPELTLADGPVTLRRRVTVEGGATVERLVLRRHPRAGAGAFTDLMVQVDGKAEAPFRWVSLIEQDGMERRYGAAIAALRTALARGPDRADLRRYLAVLLAEVGMREAAHREARRAHELEPAETASYLTWAQVLRRDPIGRATWSAPDSPGAAAVLRQGRERWPGDGAISAELARVLSSGPDGRPLRGAALEEALNQHRRLAALRGRPSKDFLLALVRAGALEELEVRARAAGEMGRPFLVHALAARRGVEVAVAELRKLELPQREILLALYQATTWARDETRDYPTLVRLLETIKELGGPGSGTLLAHARAYVRHEQVIVGQGPADAAKRFLVAMRSPESFAAARDQVFHPCMGAGRPPKQRELFFAVPFQKRPEANPDAITDHLLALNTFNAAGDDRAGYRVIASMERPPEEDAKLPSAAITFFVARDQGEPFRVVAVGASAMSMACQADRLAQAGNLKGAHVWLDWAHDAFSRGVPVPDGNVRAFLAAWRRGERASRRQVLEAIALLSPLQNPKAAVVRLKGLAARSPSEGVMGALVGAHLFAGDRKGTLETLRAFARRFPQSPIPTRLLISELAEQGRTDEARQALGEALADPKRAADPDWRRLQIRLAYFLQQPAEADAVVRALVQDPKATASHLNDAAWHFVVRGKIDAQTLDWARRAADLSRRNRAILNTLAVVEALSGNLRQAIDALDESSAIAGELEEADWLVLGAIAEALELWPEAAGYYRRLARPNVPATSQPRPDTAWAVAQARLAVVSAKGN